MHTENLELAETNPLPASDHENDNDLKASYSPAPLATSMSGQSGSLNELEEKLPLRQAIRRFPKVVAYCLALTTVIIGWGYDLVVVGAITGTDAFLADFGVKDKDGLMIIPSNWMSFWLSFPPAGAALGSISGGWIQDRIGRKFSLLIGSITSATAIAIIFFSYLMPGVDNKRIMLTAGLTLQGFSVGIIKITAITYVSENAPTSLRGSAMALFPTFTLFGQLTGSVVVFVVNKTGGQTGYLGAFGSQWVLSLAPFILSIVIPESPSYLVGKGDETRALKEATKLFAPKVDPHSALRKFRETIEEERAISSGVEYTACFKSVHLRRTLIVILANVIPALFGLDHLSNANYFLVTLGLESSKALMFMIGGIVAGMFANGAGIWILSRAGRRSMTLISMTVAALLWGGMGISGIWKGQIIAFLTGGLMVTIIVVCGLGCWPAGYAIMGETSSLQMRAKTQAVGGVTAQCSSIAMSYILPQLYNPDAAHLGPKIGFVYCGLCAIGVGLGWLWLPEMKGRTVSEIDHMFDIKLPTRKFKTYQMNGDEAATPLVAERNDYRSGGSI